MLVYRIEHSVTGLGPFQQTHESTDTSLLDTIRPLVDNLVTYPSPIEDTVKNIKDLKAFNEFKEEMQNTLFISKTDSPWKFGCQSMKEFRQWFHDGMLKNLHKFGFNLVVLQTDASNVIRLKRQCIILDKSKTTVHVKQNLLSLIR